tara:strand:+ start:672 stop:1643 length:972 start_codon:yes stop_codon:yes gene_type:complete
MLESEIVDVGREVILEESRALMSAANRVGNDFFEAAKMIYATKGKVVATGLGKSGHIARKISATLSSTGTPSCFLHPSEGLHGDLGLISDDDLLLAIAFGGETEEVLSVCDYACRRDIPRVCITGKLMSSLAKVSSLVIDGSVSREACFLNLAPTSSSTVALALGDALAIAVMRLRGFSSVEFANCHPGGALGKKLSRVSDYMRPLEPSSSLGLEDSVPLILEHLMRNNFGISPVLDSAGKVVGAITDGDFRRTLARLGSDLFDLRASQLMSLNPKTTHADVLTVSAVKFMESEQITSLFVIDDSENLVGLIRMHDLLEAKVV